MDKVQELELREREIRDELAALLESDPDSEKIGLLEREIRSVNRQIAAHKAITPDPQPVIVDETHEDVELRNLERRASVGDLFDSIMGGHQLDGAMAELQKERGLRSNEFSARQLLQLERRAATPAPADVGQAQQPIIPYVFPASVGAFLGVDMPVVAVGDAVFPVLTSELSVGAPAENAAQAETDGTFSADVLQPGRLQASFFYSREDRARFAGMDASLRMNLSDGLADALDGQIVAGTNGLLTGTNLANHNVAAVTNFATYIEAFAFGRIDGRYALETGDLRVVMGATAYAHAGAVYRNNNVDRTALDRLMELDGGVRVSAHVPEAAGNKQNNIIRRGMARDMVAPVWENIAVIEDEITKAGTGQIVLTAVMLHAVKILRADGFYKQQVQTA